MDNNPASSRKILMILLFGGALLLLFLLIGVIVILRGSQNTQQATGTQPTPVTNEPTIVPISGPLKIIEPSSQPVTALKTLATNFTFLSPAGFSTSVTDHSGVDIASTVVFIQNEQKRLSVTIDTSAQKVPSKDLALNPGKQSPRIYAYSPQDFETIAIVDGKELVVSRTGAADVMVVNNNERVYALPEMVAKNESSLGSKTEYYVYQKYGSGISEYLSIFQNPNGVYPSYTNYTMVSYYITSTQESTNWETHKKILIAILSGLKKK